MRDFETVWTELKPFLDGFEARRKKAVRQVAFGGVAAVGLAALTVVLLSLTGLPGPMVFFAAMAAAFGAYTLGSRRMTALSREVKAALNDRLAEAFGLRYAKTPASPVHFSEFASHGLIPNSDRRSFEDHFAGESHGAAFELYEAHLQQRRRSRRRTYYVTVFRGVLIRIAFPRTIEGVTLVTRDRGIFNAFERWAKSAGRHGLARIGLPDPKFNSIFEVYGTDQVMARYLVTPSFMERLLELEDALRGRNVRAVFDEGLAEGEGRGEMLIAAETGNLFEPGSLFTPMADRARIEALYRDFALVERIVDTVLAPPANTAPAP
jgi:hypothetical protein